MARAPWAGQEIYDAVAEFARRCLVEDGSLFVPGQSVWTLDAAELLGARVGRDEKTGTSFIDKLRLQVSGLDSDVVLLAAEVLYLELLAELDTGGEQKETHMRSILSVLDPPVSIPESLGKALHAGGVANFSAGKSHRDAYVRFLCRVIAEVKSRGAAERAKLVDDPWQFRELTEGVRTSTDGLQVHALLNLLYPDAFEYVIGPASRQQLIAAFAAAPGVAGAQNDDRRLEAIRRNADAVAGRQVDFYSDPFHRVWAGEPNDRWDEFTSWAARLYERPDFDKRERNYKVDLAGKLAEPRRLLLADDDRWLPAFTKALKASENNLLDFRVTDTFSKWCADNPEVTHRALEALWAEGAALADRVQEFLEILPREPVSGAGTRASVCSLLLMATDDPPGFFKPTVFSKMKKALALPGSPLVDPEATYRPEELAARLGVSGKRIRDFLRASFSRDPSEDGEEWRLDGEQAQAVIDRFSADPESNKASGLFFEWRELLEALAFRLLARGVQIRDAIDVQGLVFRVVFDEPPKDWPERDREALVAFRAGKPVGNGDGTEPPGGQRATLPAATTGLARELFLETAWLQEAIDLLAEKKQIVFYGPPGTGKTFIGRRLAKHLTSAGGTFRLVQFHPSYTYEDFFEGYRPRSGDDGDLSFELAQGALREMADAARREPEKPHVLIVDEINRGNVAKVFGELYFLLEYRDEEIQLQYSPRERFSLPENLFLIGTMNTADRSIALVDSALRRRFYFVELSPTSSPVDGVLRGWLDEHGLDPEPADLLDALNAAIGDDDFAIGPSYFMTKDGSAPDLDRVWRRAIKPLLEEHYFGSGRDVEAEFGVTALRKNLAEAADSTAPEPDEDDDSAG